MSLSNHLPGKTVVACSLAAVLTGGTAAVAATVVFSHPNATQAQAAGAVSSARDTAALNSAAASAAKAVSASNAAQLSRISAQDAAAKPSNASSASNSSANAAPVSTLNGVTAAPAGTQAGVLSSLPDFLSSLPGGTVTAVQAALGSGVPNLLGNLGSFNYGQYLSNLPSGLVTTVQYAIPTPAALSGLLGDLGGPNAAQP